MCWIENIERLNLQRTDKDIEVYKIVSEASKQSCKSIIRNFIYKVNTVYEMSSMTFERTSISVIYYNSNLVHIEKAYHSYTKIRYTLEKVHVQNSIYEHKGIIVGNLLMPIRVNNILYVATFIIPKGSQYAINWKGEIVSDQIIYTGKYLKL